VLCNSGDINVLATAVNFTSRKELDASLESGIEDELIYMVEKLKAVFGTSFNVNRILTTEQYHGRRDRCYTKHSIPTQNSMYHVAERLGYSKLLKVLKSMVEGGAIG